MTGAELLEYVRSDLLRDSAQPYLWSDELIFKYLTEAQQIMAEETYCLSDNSTESITTITTEADTAEYDLSDLVLHVYSARVSTVSYNMRDWTSRVVPSHLLTTTGQPVAYSLDEALGVIRFYPVPEDEYTIYLRVARLPQTAISDDDDPEIPTRLHIDLGDFAAYRCLLNNDVDGNNKGAAAEFLGAWHEKLSKAKHRYYRLRHGANPTAMTNWTGKRR